MKHLRLVRTGREPDTIACKDEAAAAAPDPSLSRGVAPPTDGASRPAVPEAFFCRDPFGQWIESILEDKERNEEL